MIKKIIALAIAAVHSVAFAGGPYAAGACQPIPSSKSCIDATPCKVDSSGAQLCLAGVSLPAGAISVAQTCWKYSYQYACSDPASSVNTCGAYETDKKCQLLTTKCLDTVKETGQCSSWSYTYKCETKAAETGKQLQCSGTGLFDDTNVPKPNNANDNFSKAALAMEIQREMTVYSQSGQTSIFSGTKESCTKGYFGAKNCCKGIPGAQSNLSVVQSLGVQAAYGAVKYAGQVAVDTVSPYVFDAMFSSGLFSDGMMTSIAGSSSSILSEGGNLATNFAGNGLTFGAYGFTYGTGTFVAGDAMAGTSVLMEGSSGYLAFNPYVLVASLVFQYVMSLMNCTQEEQMLGMHKQANLSVYVGEQCINSILGSCLEYQDDYCSFNSVLAKIINQQGKAQLGLDFSSCSGLSIDQVTKLDFSKVDFSEFAATMLEQAKKGMPSSSAISNAYQSVIPTLQSGTSQQSGNGTAYPK
ncbi:conjugal transfer protein TraN [Herbaspirillum sp.]|uniref:conjugal transfer protein TraN n=1 Tax=Herbaspirillum sp. TaxID=1890675 RepID=UPI000C0B5C90|nr:conjugal transfer protein TraN [Herbaspirillum sp.]MAF04707.1 conjugal transfer protein TraN [Herbaspirillum sp.]|tara:strand:+ start:23594 stop:25000 length:1407 start_codon:yes stop_codon:yes gene_type:complete